MARPFRLPTYHDPRAQLVARAGQLLHDLLDTLGQLQQLQQVESSGGAAAEAPEWVLQEEGPDGPQQHLVQPDLLVEALRTVSPNLSADTLERVVSERSDGGAALAALVSCHHDPPHSAPAAPASARAAPTPMSLPLPTTCARQSAQSTQSWHEVGNDLRRLADQLSLDNRLQATSCAQPKSEGGVLVPKSGSVGLIQSLLALVMPKKLSYSATFMYVGMRLLKFNLKEF